MDDIYSELHQKDKEQESGNVYDASQPRCSYRKEGSETNVYTYNHLHEKPIEIAESIYDDPNTKPWSSFSTKPVEKFWVQRMCFWYVFLVNYIVIGIK